MAGEHARLSASASHRWLHCPASVLLIEEAGQVPDEDSPFAAEGTRAHTIAEIEAAWHFDLIDGYEYEERKAAWESTLLDGEREPMLESAEGYIALIQSKVDAYPGATVLLEQRLETGIPSCWGTSDCVVVAPGVIEVIDLKYGTGVLVDAEKNPQLMLYGVAALETFDMVAEAEDVCVTVYQPRRNHVDSYCLPADDLRAWRDSVIPIAKAALEPGAEFGPGEDACRWCPVAGECSARARFISREAFGEPALLTPKEMAEALSRIADIRRWCQQVEERALSKAYRDGVNLPGWKVVRTSGRRQITDHAAAIQTLIDLGFKAEQVANFTTKPFGELERLLSGKGAVEAVIGEFIGKTEGKPSLAPVDDKREAITALGEESKMFTPV